jgi:hypothetical protein
VISLPHRRLARIAAALALASLLGCAATGLTPVDSNQPVARQALQPEFRVFYDALIDYGDWVLIEPYGFVFRPRVAWNQWQPFEDGFWAPTDAYGWVWISAEPFGWATYHYGQWLFDRFQGWVWIPGIEWMPGSVTWLASGDYVGWGPLTAHSSFNDAAPAASTHWAPLSQLGSTDLRTRMVPADRLGAAVQNAQPIRNVARMGGVTIELGPSIESVEQLRGPLVRARIEDLVPVDLGRRIAGPPTRASLPGRAVAGTDSTALANREAIESMQRAAQQAAFEARQLVQISGTSPSSLPVVRPIFGPRVTGVPPGLRRREVRTPEHAPADSSR